MQKDMIFNTFWHGGSLSAMERVCMQSFPRHNHLLRVFTYTPLETPPGVSNEDASTVLGNDRLFVHCNSVSAFTNIFRYKLLYEQGGWWVDTDVLCRTPQVPDCDYFWACESLGRINGAVLKFPIGDPVCLTLLRLSEERSLNLIQWGQLGPALLSEVLSTFKPRRRCGTTLDVYPVHYHQTHFFWLPEFLYEVEEKIANSTFVHLWHSVCQRMNIDGNTPPRGSFMFKLYKDYQIEVRPDPKKGKSNRDNIHQYLCTKNYDRKYRGNFEFPLFERHQVGALMTKSDLTIPEYDADVAIADLQTMDPDARFGSVNSIVMDRGEKIKLLTESLAHSDGRIAVLNAIITQQRAEIADIRRELKQSKSEQAQLSRTLARLEEMVKRLEQRIAAIYASKSWRITVPLRFASKLIRSLPPKGT
jgi:hypothetical protein